MSELVPVERIESKICLIRGQKVMLDRDLAQLYGVETFNLNKAAKRNRERFPDDFMFQLTKEEWGNLKFHSGISNLKSHIVISSWGGRRTPPYAFTEQGVAMLSSVLHSKRAVQVNIMIMRAFVKLRHILATHKELREKIEQMEKKYDKQFAVVFAYIKSFLDKGNEPKTKKIGFLK